MPLDDPNTPEQMIPCTPDMQSRAHPQETRWPSVSPQTPPQQLHHGSPGPTSVMSEQPPLQPSASQPSFSDGFGRSPELQHRQVMRNQYASQPQLPYSTAQSSTAAAPQRYPTNGVPVPMIHQPQTPFPGRQGIPPGQQPNQHQYPGQAWSTYSGSAGGIPKAQQRTTGMQQQMLQPTQHPQRTMGGPQQHSNKRLKRSKERL